MIYVKCGSALIGLALGLTMLAGAGWGWWHGELTGRNYRMTRAGNPVSFWLTEAWFAVFGTLATVYALLQLAS